MTDDLGFALSLADAADAITLPRFRAADLRVDTKPDTTVVSDADRAAEQALRDLVARERPGEGVLGEEYGDDGTDVRWIVDPVDGTTNFVRGVPVWATLIALQRDGQTTLAVVSAPALRRRWWAVHGRGAYADGERVRVSAIARVEDASISITSIRSLRRRGLAERYVALAERAWSSRALGDFWQHALVAEGSVDVALETALNLWDYAPVQLIVEEAGGRCTDFAGEPPRHGSTFVATNGLLHDAILEALAGAST
ncbi:MAG: histidinol-phosphatase [Thermoleophilia bacterium]|nr:histidinol-phosphatase [Thermoleophilia bacterium]